MNVPARQSDDRGAGAAAGPRERIRHTWKVLASVNVGLFMGTFRRKESHKEHVPPCKRTPGRSDPCEGGRLVLYSGSPQSCVPAAVAAPLAVLARPRQRMPFSHRCRSSARPQPRRRSVPRPRRGYSLARRTLWQGTPSWPVALLALAAGLLAPRAVRAQRVLPDTLPRRASVSLPLPALAADTAPCDTASERNIASGSRRGGWLRFSLGIATSLVAHEGGHIVSALAMGAHPHIGLDRARPTVFSGIDADRDPDKQLVFSSSGLVVQMLMNEAILDIPHERGSAFERGVLAGGVGTMLFYATLGRNSEVSDVTWIARTSSLSRTQVALLLGSLAAIQAVRIHLNDRYAHFFAFPSAAGGATVGVRVTGDP